MKKENLPRTINRHNKHFLRWLKEKIKEDWGEKCPDYEPECPCCRAWKMFEKLTN